MVIKIQPAVPRAWVVY